MITSDDKIKIKKLREVGCSQREISLALDIKRSTLSDFITGKTHRHKAYAWQVPPESIKDEDRIVGVIPDTHAPFSNKHTIQFLIESFESRGVNTIVHIGDVIELHAASRFLTEQKALNYVDELILARDFLKELSILFPYVTITYGNHDKINLRKAKEYGIDLESLKPMNQYLELPDTWRWVDKVDICGVRYIHKGRGGALGAINTAKEVGKSTVVGHSHVNGGCSYRHNGSNIYFGLDVGALIDKESYSCNYAAEFFTGISQGCGVVYNSSHAEFIPLYNA